jgi:hypothetical protein
MAKSSKRFKGTSIHSLLSEARESGFGQAGEGVLFEESGVFARETAKIWLKSRFFKEF